MQVVFFILVYMDVHSSCCMIDSSAATENTALLPQEWCSSFWGTTWGIDNWYFTGNLSLLCSVCSRQWLWGHFLYYTVICNRHYLHLPERFGIFRTRKHWLFIYEEFLYVVSGRCLHTGSAVLLLDEIYVNYASSIFYSCLMRHIEIEFMTGSETDGLYIHTFIVILQPRGWIGTIWKM